MAVREDPPRLAPGIRSSLDAENAYTAAMLAPSKAVQDALFAAMLRIAADDAVPTSVVRGAWSYTSYISKNANYPVFVRRPAKGGPAQIMLDANARAKGHKYYALSIFQPPQFSPDGTLFAWTSDAVGSEYFRIHIQDLKTGRITDTGIDKCFGSFTVSSNSQYLFWVFHDPLSRPTKVFRRSLANRGDTLVYEEKDPALFMDATLTASRTHVLIYCSMPIPARFISSRAIRRLRRRNLSSRAGRTRTIRCRTGTANWRS